MDNFLRQQSFDEQKLQNLKSLQNPSFSVKEPKDGNFCQILNQQQNQIDAVGKYLASSVASICSSELNFILKTF